MLRRQSVDRERLPEATVAKWGAELLSEGFTPLPKRLLRCLSCFFRGENALEELAVIMAVADYRRPNLERPPSVEFLAFIAGMTPERFKKRLDDLEKRGWIATVGVADAIDVRIEPLIRKIVELTQDD